MMNKTFSMIREFHLADWFTLGNAVCGTGAMFSMMTYLQTSEVMHIYFACALVVAAMVFDVLDGRIARWRQKTSPMGRELDSLADIISFGVAQRKPVGQMELANHRKSLVHHVGPRSGQVTPLLLKISRASNPALAYSHPVLDATQSPLAAPALSQPDAQAMALACVAQTGHSTNCAVPPSPVLPRPALRRPSQALLKTD